METCSAAGGTPADGEAALPRTSAWLRARLDAGQLVGAQVHVGQAGKTVADLAAGMARSGVPMTPTTLNYWFCCTKPVIAIAAAQLVESQLMSLDDQVCDIIPPFRAGGKESVTIRHLLTHTAGLRRFTRPRPFLASDREILSAVCRSEIQDGWQPGHRAAYTPFASWYVLGELVQLLSGERLPDYVRRHVFEPLGIDNCWLGIPSGIASRERVNLAIPHAVTPGRAPVPITFLASEATLQLVNAASGAIGPISGLGRIFQAILHPERTGGVLSPATIQMFVSPSRRRLFDETYGFRWDWGLGFAVELGRLCSAASGPGFGHPGGSVLVLADRGADRVVALALNGLTAWGGVPEVSASSAVSQLARVIYGDLGAA